ncbi:MAG: hypothetical protein KA035_01875 [Candidatus Levybacteria bacterium]|nr:hypothetical protein [Candidatus Levybacteria bacterium]
MEKKLIQFYKKYSEIILPVVLLLSAVLIFFQVTLPNFLSIQSTHEEVNSEQQKLDSYKSSYSVLNNLNEQKINEDVVLATQALPSEKDPGSIYLAVVEAATDAGAELKAFSIQVGDILGKETLAPGVPQRILVNVKLSGMDQVAFKSFANRLLTELPISTMSEVRISEDDADIDLNFYYMPYNLALINAEIITSLNAAEQKTLTDLNR